MEEEKKVEAATSEEQKPVEEAFVAKDVSVYVHWYNRRSRITSPRLGNCR